MTLLRNKTLTSTIILILVSVIAGDDVNLYSVDRTIVRLLSKPLPGTGNLLLNNIRLYNSTLSKILSLFMQKDMKVATIAEILWERNGPRFLVRRMDDQELQDTYGWSITDLTTMYELLNETQDIWRHLRIEYSKMLTERLQQEGIIDNVNEV
uniref:Uncharacterized protein n=1 Tax=Cuerna arida TaxID=1464854 RepID=A0A1B6GIW0_9HEMI